MMKYDIFLFKKKGHGELIQLQGTQQPRKSCKLGLETEEDRGLSLETDLCANDSVDFWETEQLRLGLRKVMPYTSTTNHTVHPQSSN